jgi:hypothetical protein
MGKRAFGTVPEDPNLEEDDDVIGRAFAWSIALSIGAAVLIALLIWWIGGEDEPPPQAAPVIAGPGVTPEAEDAPQVRFTDVTKAAGIEWTHVNGARGRKYLPETMGPGCAFLDYDGDGDPDLLFVNSAAWPWDAAGRRAPSPPALYRNDGTGRFEDVSAEAGFMDTFYGQGVACGDVDDDGDVDVFLTGVGENRLYRNDGGRFADVTAAAGLTAPVSAWCTSAGFADLDADGDLDLFVCNYVTWSRRLDDAQSYTIKGIGRAYARPTSFAGTHSFLYRNDGGGQFADVSEQAGIQVANPATGVPVGKALGVVFADFDWDGDLDLFVANDTVRNFLFENRGGLRFEEVGERSGVAYDSRGRATGAMGVDAAPVREGETSSIAVGNYASEMSSLFMARGRDLLFSDAAISEGIGAPSRRALSFGVLFLDYDLDGHLDVFQTNGHLEDEINKVQPSQHYEQPSQLFWNAGPEARSAYAIVDGVRVGDLSKKVVGRGAACADIDLDGDSDLVVAQCGRSPLLLRNDQALGHRWLRVVLKPKGVRSPIGATVTLKAGGMTQRRLVNPTRSYLSQVELPLTFGLGAATRVDSLEVRWPDGTTQSVVVPAVDRILVIDQR